jgi:hypothetical protein
MPTAFATKRKYPRHSLPHGISVAWKARGGTNAATAGAIGMGGLFLHSKDTLPVNSVIEMDLDLNDSKLHIRAKVRDSVPGKGMGLQFVQMNTTDRYMLNKFLSHDLSDSGKAESGEPVKKEAAKKEVSKKSDRPRSRVVAAKKFGGKERSVRRCALVASAEITESQSNTRLSARTSELAIGGCYIDALNPFPAGTVVDLRIVRDHGVFATKAKVVYCHPGCGMGLAFTAIPPDQRSILEEWLAEIIADQLTPVSQ